MPCTAFLNNITSIDYTTLGYGGILRGASSRIDLKVVDKEEEPIHFNDIQESVISLLKHPETGFDHKLWISPNESNATIKVSEDQIEIQTPAIDIISPLNSVQLISNQVPSQDIIEDYLQREMMKLYPNISLSLKLKNLVPYVRKSRLFFHFTHGIKTSTVWDHQNLFHGHQSWISFYDQDDNNVPMPVEFIQKYLKTLDNHVFIWSNTIDFDNEKGVQVEYTSERGKYQAWYCKDKNNIIVLDKEPIIGNILDWIIEQCVSDLNHIGIRKVFLSEGISNGVYINF